ncbi:MAG: hypothetical protein ACREP7_11965 [Lysobacter sp.]
MRSNVSLSRAVVAGVLLAVIATSGCSWFRKGNKLYAETPENRPLEVPPDLDQPRTDGAMAIPAAGSATASGVAASRPTQAAAGTPASSAIGFTVSGNRDDVFGKVGDALGKVEGLTVASRAQLLGAFDVNYQSSNFLVRVSTVEAGTYVSAVDPRGLPATGEAPTKLIASLKSTLGGR